MILFMYLLLEFVPWLMIVQPELNFDTSFDPALRFSEAFKASLSEINGPLSHPVC